MHAENLPPPPPWPSQSPPPAPELPLPPLSPPAPDPPLPLSPAKLVQNEAQDVCLCRRICNYKIIVAFQGLLGIFSARMIGT